MASGTSNLDYLMRPTPAQVLETAIFATPTDRLRKVLLHACSSSQATAEILRGLLLIGGPAPIQVVDLTEENDESESDHNTGSDPDTPSDGDDSHADDHSESEVDEDKQASSRAPSTNETHRKRKRAENEEKLRSPARLPTDIRSILNPVSTNSQPAKKHRLNGLSKPRYLTCQNCEKEYDVTLNVGQPCRYQSSYKMVDDDSDFWADHDEDCHGHYESFENDPDCQAGFIWECCERSGGEEGCMQDRHRNKLDH